MHSTYSWMGTNIHLVLNDEIADAYNRAQAAFLKAQKEFKARTGFTWNGHDTLHINWTEEEMRVYNALAAVINAMVELNGGSIPITEEECTSDYLVKV